MGRGLMVGTVARATHKHFRDVNKRVHVQMTKIDIFSSTISFSTESTDPGIKSSSVFEKGFGVLIYFCSLDVPPSLNRTCFIVTWRLSAVISD